jgi:hypothetical protein
MMRDWAKIPKNTEDEAGNHSKGLEKGKENSKGLGKALKAPERNWKK